METEKKITIVFICHNMAYKNEGATNTGGMQKTASELLAGLKRRNKYNIKEITLKCKEKDIWFKAPLYFIKLPVSLILKTWNNKDIIVLYASMIPAISIITTSVFPITKQHTQIAMCHGLDIIQGNFMWQKLVKMTLKRIDRVIANSNATKEQCLKRGINDKKISIIHPAIGLKRSTKNKILETKEKNFICLIVGRQIKRKGTSWFIREVMPILPETVKLWIVGTGPETKNIRKEISKRCLESRIRLLGKVSDSTLEGIYSQTDIFVMPNIKVNKDMEGFGRVILEAGLAGLYTVGSNIEGIKDAITKSNGALIEHKNAHEYKKEIMRIKDLSLKERNELENKIREHIKEKYAFKNIINDFENIFIKTHNCKN